MKKICYVTTVATTFKTFVLDTANYLRDQGGYQVAVVCHPDNQLEEILEDDILYHPIKMRRGFNLDGLRAIIQMIKFFRQERFDIVQYSTPNASFYTAIAATLAGVPVRLYCQWGILYVGASGWKRQILKLLERTTCKLSTWVEPDSFGNLDFSHQEKLYSSKKSSVILYGSAKGVNLKKFDIQQKLKWNQEIRKKYGISSEDFVIGFIGRITKDKGFNELIKAMQGVLQQNLSREIKLLIIGNNEVVDKIEPELYEWSQKNPHVIYCGHTNVVEKYLAAMDVFVLPSYREGFGSMVIEAEAMAIPVVVTNIPGPLDAMIKDETGLVVEKFSSEELIQALLYIEAHPEIASQMGAKGRQFVEDYFDDRKLRQAILEDRDRLIGDSSRSKVGVE